MSGRSLLRALCDSSDFRSGSSRRMLCRSMGLDQSSWVTADGVLSQLRLTAEMLRLFYLASDLAMSTKSSLISLSWSE